MSARVPSALPFVWTFLALVVLAASSFGLSYLSLGPFEMPLALLIGAAKAALVMLVFMELRHTSFVPRLVVVVILAWLTLLIGFMVLDVLTRQDPGVRPPLPPPSATSRP